MTLPFRRAIAAAALAAVAATLAPPAAGETGPGGIPLAAQDCQRACLEGYMNRYLQAMVDQDRSDALFARDVKFTENGVQMPLGNEGLWATASGLGNYKFYVPDTFTRQVAFMGTMMEQTTSSAAGAARPPEPVGIDVRLKIDDEGKISEVEQIVARPDRPLGPAPAAPATGFGATGANVEKMGAPHPIFLQAVPEKERMSREDLIAVANQYFEGMQRNDGKGYYPFADDCLRHENGMISAGPPGTLGMTGNPVQTCKGQYENGLRNVVSGIRDRRFVAVDRERGLVFAFGAFDHRNINWTWEIGEIFKIEKNQIRRIEAIFIRGPYGVCSGWSTYEQCRSEEIQDVR